MSSVLIISSVETMSFLEAIATSLGATPAPNMRAFPNSSHWWTWSSPTSGFRAEQDDRLAGIRVSNELGARLLEGIAATQVAHGQEWHPEGAGEQAMGEGVVRPLDHLDLAVSKGLSNEGIGLHPTHVYLAHAATRHQ